MDIVDISRNWKGKKESTKEDIYSIDLDQLTEDDQDENSVSDEESEHQSSGDDSSCSEEEGESLIGQHSECYELGL